MESRNPDVEAAVSATPNLDASDEHFISLAESVRHLKGMNLPCLQPSREFLGSPARP